MNFRSISDRDCTRACLKNHFRNLQAPLCGIFYPHSVAVARYAALIRIKSPTNWDSQLNEKPFSEHALEIDIWEIDTIGVEKEVLNVDDVIETVNHFRCIDMIIDHAKAALTEKFIKELHLVLKNGTSDSRKEWFAVGDYKKLPNEVGGRDTALPEEVADKMKALLTEYSAKEEKTFEDILDFHVNNYKETVGRL